MLNRRLHAADLTAVLIIFTAILGRSAATGDPGVGWHLKTGEWILEMRAIPRIDPFLLTSGDKPWVATQWLADSFLFSLYQLAGFPLLHLLTIALFSFSHVIIPGSVLRALRVPPVIAGTALLVGVSIGALQWIMRPVLFGFLCFAAAYAHAHSLAGRGENERRLTWGDYLAAALLFAIWANLHSSFPLGFFVYGVSLGFSGRGGSVLNPDLQADRSAERRKEWRRKIVFLLCIVAATLINPYGIALHQNIFGLVNSEFFMKLNQEWLSPDFHLPEFWRFALVLVLLLFGALLGFRGKVSAFEATIAAVLILLSLKTRRYLPFCAIALVPVIAHQLSAVLNRYSSWLTTYLPNFQRLLLAWDSSPRVIPPLTTLLLSSIALYVLVTDHLPFRDNRAFDLDQHYPARVMGQLDKVRDQGRAIFHSPDYGGYITWRFYPRIRAFIDDRNELNGEELYREYFKVVRMEDGWEGVLRKYNFEWLLLEKKTFLARYMAVLDPSSRTPQWRLLAEDENVALYEKISTPLGLNDLTSE